MKLPPRGEVDLWQIGRSPGFHDLSLLTADEVQRGERFRFPRDRERFWFTQSRKRKILASYLDKKPESLAFQIGEQGKPSLGGLNFSISHTEHLSLLAVSPHDAVGVDCETSSSPLDLLDASERILSIREKEAWLAVPAASQAHQLLRIWTAKEAYLKALGCGLLIEPNLVECGFPNLSFGKSPNNPKLSMTEIEIAGGVAHLATHEPAPRIRHLTSSPP